MSKKLPHQADEETTYWLSYSDMMAALLLIFILIISFTILQSKITYEKKEQQLSEQQETLENQQKMLDKLLIQSQEKEQQLSEQQVIMDKQQEQIDKLIGVRGDLIEALKKEFAGSSLGIQVDSQTGAITFDSSILFDYNQFVLKDSGKNFLVDFLPRYINLLMTKSYAKYIGEIIIEGHTDTAGDYLFNLELSQKRALSVASFCLSSDGSVPLENVEQLRKIITANGKSFSNPVYNTDGTVNMEASRRVEFKFRLKDEEMIEEMKGILSEK